MICLKCTLFVRRIHHKHMTYNQMLQIRQTCAIQKGMICTKCTLLAHSIFKVFVMGGKIFPFSFWSRKDSHECNAACEQNYAFLCHRSKVQLSTFNYLTNTQELYILFKKTIKFRVSHPFRIEKAFNYQTLNKNNVRSITSDLTDGDL